MTPTVTMEAPRTVTMNIGKRLWIISEEMSMNSEPNPIAQIPPGKPRHAAWVPWLVGELFAARGPIRWL
jgi:hypothetical protein